MLTLTEFEHFARENGLSDLILRAHALSYCEFTGWLSAGQVLELLGDEKKNQLFALAETRGYKDLRSLHLSRIAA